MSKPRLSVVLIALVVLLLALFLRPAAGVREVEAEIAKVGMPKEKREGLGTEESAVAVLQKEGPEEAAVVIRTTSDGKSSFWLSSGEPYPRRAEVRGYIAKFDALVDSGNPDAALALIDGIEDRTVALLVVNMVMGVFAREHPLLALRWAVARGEDSVLEPAMTGIGAAAVQLPLEESLGAIMAIKAESAQMDLLLAFATALVKQERFGDLAAVGKAIDGMREERRNQARLVVGVEVARKQPEVALGLLMQITNLEIRDSALGVVALGLRKDQEKLALLMAERISDEKSRVEVVRRVTAE